MKRRIIILLAALTVTTLSVTQFSNSVPDARSVVQSTVAGRSEINSLRSSADRSAQPGEAAAAKWTASRRGTPTGGATVNRPVPRPQVADYPGSRSSARTAFASRRAAGRMTDESERSGLRQTVEWLGEALLRSEDPLLREQAAVALAEIGGEAGYLALAGALADPDTQVRELVIQLLGEAGHDQLYLLGQVLFTEPDPELRRQAVEVIALLQSPAALALLQVALQDGDAEVALLAESRLADRGWAGEQGYAADPAVDNGAFFASAARIDAIHRTYLQDPERAVAFLSDLVVQDQDSYVREEAIIALAGIGGEEARLAVAGALGDAEIPVRELAIQLLAESDGEVLPLLGQVLFGEADAELRRQAVAYIAHRQGPAALALLEAAAGDTDEAVSREAHRALRRKL